MLKGNFSDLSLFTDEENAFWDRLSDHVGETFCTAKGLTFQYRIVGGEMFISRKRKSINRASVIRAYRRAKELQIVTGPKKLDVFGASYIYPIFLRMNVCTKAPEDAPTNPAD